MEPHYYLAAWKTPRASSNSAAKRIFHGRGKAIGTADEVARLRSEVSVLLGPGASLDSDGMLMIEVPASRLREASADLLAAVEEAGYNLYDPQVGRLVVPMTQMAAPWPPEWTGPMADLQVALATAAVAGTDGDHGAAAESDIRAIVADLAAEKDWGLWEVGSPRPPTVERWLHVAPELEALIPAGLVDSDAKPTSGPMTGWGQPGVNRALRLVGVRPRDAVVVSALGGKHGQVHTVTLFGVPGVAADQLAGAFGAAIYKPRRARWERRNIAGRAVWWAEAKDFIAPGQDFTAAWWTRDGLVVWITGQPAWLEAAAAALP